MDMFESVENLKGIGPKTAEILKKAGIRTLRDFFYNLPRDYENYTAPTSIAEIMPGKVVVKGRISDLKSRRASKSSMVQSKLPAQTICTGQRVLFYGGIRAQKWAVAAHFAIGGFGIRCRYVGRFKPYLRGSRRAKIG